MAVRPQSSPAPYAEKAKVKPIDRFFPEDKKGAAQRQALTTEAHKKALDALNAPPSVPSAVLQLAESGTPLGDKELATIATFLTNFQRPGYLVNAHVVPARGKMVDVNRKLMQQGGVEFDRETDGQLMLAEGKLVAYFCRSTTSVSSFPSGSFVLVLPAGQSVSHVTPPVFN